LTVSGEPIYNIKWQNTFNLSIFVQLCGPLKYLVSWFWLPPATKAPHGHPSPRWRAEENEKKQAETGGSG